MKVSELMAGVTPSAEFAGAVTAADMVLAIDFSGEAETPADYIVADEGITEQSGALEAVTAESTCLLYTSMLMRSGELGTVIGSGKVSYIAPYARRLYYCLLYTSARRGPARVRTRRSRCGPWWRSGSARCPGSAGSPHSAGY